MSARPLPPEADANQARASDPSASAWVSANAGTGKTEVLVKRVLRLLLAGFRPESILCLTYTKAAAAEMQNRLLKVLADWATTENEKSEVRNAISRIAKAIDVSAASAYTERRPDSTQSGRCARAPYSDAAMP